MSSTSSCHDQLSLSPVRRRPDQDRATAGITRRNMLAGVALGLVGTSSDAVSATPHGQFVWATHISLAPAWFDPAETGGVITPFMLLYALHDGLMKPMPGNPMDLCLAESHTESADGLSHDFMLRDATFHNGEKVTAEDVKFSFERYHENAARFIKDKVAIVETPGPRRVVFRLHKPWPDFLIYYSSVTGAGWVVPKAYVERVRDDGFTQ